MKKKTLLLIVSAIAVLLLGLVGVGNFFYDKAVKRGTDVELHSEEDTVNVEASEQDQALLQEAKDWFEVQQPTTLTMEAYDGLTLKAQFFGNTDNPEKKAVVIAHGFGSVSSDMGKYVKMYYDQGFDVLLPDGRGHGDSEGDYIGYGWHDRLDYMDWIQLLVEDYGEEVIFLHGNSMGAATVLMTSGENLPPQVKGIIADSSYSTMKEELAHQLKNIYNLPAFPLLQVTSGVTYIRAGYTFGDVSVLDQVKKNTLPLLLIHGDADDLVPTRMAYEIYDVAGGNKELWIVPEAGHTKSFDNNTAVYGEKIEEFLRMTLAD